MIVNHQPPMLQYTTTLTASFTPPLSFSAKSYLVAVSIATKLNITKYTSFALGGRSVISVPSGAFADDARPKMHIQLKWLPSCDCKQLVIPLSSA